MTVVSHIALSLLHTVLLALVMFSLGMVVRSLLFFEASHRVFEKIGSCQFLVVVCSILKTLDYCFGSFLGLTTWLGVIHLTVIVWQP